MDGTMLVIGALVLVVVGGAVFAGFTILNPSRTASDRLGDLTTTEVEEDKTRSFLQEEEEDGVNIAGRIGALAASQDQEAADLMRRQLVQAGYKNKNAYEMFNSLRVTMAVCIPVLLAPFAASLSTAKLGIAVFVGAAAGYYIPAAMVTSRIEKRQAVLLKAFPDALDMLVSSVEAGLGLDAAFRRVSEELAGSSPELAAEFQVVNHEIGAGVPRVQALKHLEERTGLDEIRSLVNLLTQAERFGTSVARSLRVHSKITREKRMSRAEEEAAKVSPKLTVIMILFLLPCLIVVLLGPAIVQIKRNFLGE